VPPMGSLETDVKTDDTTIPLISNPTADWMSRATDLRLLLQSARNVEESRLLVDMFLIQCGLDIAAESSTIVAPIASAPVIEPLVHDTEKSVFELLLGDGDVQEGISGESDTVDAQISISPPEDITFSRSDSPLPDVITLEENSHLVSHPSPQAIHTAA